MPDDLKPGHSRIRTWFCGLLAGLAMAYVFGVVRQALDDIIGPPEAQLIVTSEAPLLDVRVRYGGQDIAPRPGWVQGSHLSYALFPAMRTRTYETILEVTWKTQTAERSVSQVMRQNDAGRLCLYVLRLDPTGNPVPLEPLGSLPPFWWDCHFR